MTRVQAIREEVLLQLYGAGQSIALTPQHMTRTAKRAGDDFSEKEVLEAALFLVGQGFAQEVNSESTGIRRFQITSKGMLEHERNGS